MTKDHMEFLEENPARMRKHIALITTYVWVLCVIASYLFSFWGKESIAILSLVTAQFATVVGFYMLSNAKSDNHKEELE